MKGESQIELPQEVLNFDGFTKILRNIGIVSGGSLPSYIRSLRSLSLEIVKGIISIDDEIKHHHKDLFLQVKPDKDSKDETSTIFIRPDLTSHDLKIPEGMTPIIYLDRSFLSIPSIELYVNMQFGL